MGFVTLKGALCTRVHDSDDEKYENNITLGTSIVGAVVTQHVSFFLLQPYGPGSPGVPGSQQLDLPDGGRGYHLPPLNKSLRGASQHTAACEHYCQPMAHTVAEPPSLLQGLNIISMECCWLH